MSLTDDELRARWRAAGGNFHGPHVETGTMPESMLLPFLRDLVIDMVGHFAIETEKLLCAKIGRPWTPAGISIHTLVEELKPARPWERFDDDLEGNVAPVPPEEREAIRRALAADGAPPPSYQPGTIRVDMHWDDTDGQHHSVSGYINESWLLQRKRELESTHEQ